jgi:hypothetical protein
VNGYGLTVVVATLKHVEIQIVELDFNVLGEKKEAEASIID